MLCGSERHVGALRVCREALRCSARLPRGTWGALRVCREALWGSARLPRGTLGALRAAERHVGLCAPAERHFGGSARCRETRWALRACREALWGSARLPRGSLRPLRVSDSAERHFGELFAVRSPWRKLARHLWKIYRPAPGLLSNRPRKRPNHLRSDLRCDGRLGGIVRLLRHGQSLHHSVGRVVSRNSVSDSEERRN